MARVRVAVIDSDAPFRARLVQLLKGMPEIEVVGEAGDGNAVDDLIRRVRPDVLLLGLKMPGVDVEEFVRRVRQLPPGERCRVVMLASSCKDRDLLSAITAGADEYLLRDSGSGELLNIILSVFKGSPEETRHVSGPLDRVSAAGTQEAGEICLSPREMEVLALLAQRKTSVQIAEQLFISENTVKTHVRHIFVKLSASSRVEAVHKAAQMGLI